jgi:FlaA1/EpsC-like NDP-sugar epimerase
MFSNRNIRYWRIFLILTVYSAVLTGSFFMAYLLRFDFSVPPSEMRRVPNFLLWIVPTQLIALLCLGQCAGLLSYFSLPDIRRLFYGLAIPSLLLLALWHYDSVHYFPPRSVLLGNFVLAFGGLCASRLCFRIARERYATTNAPALGHCRRVGIIGAGYVGASLARDLISKKGLGMQPVAFFDDDPGKWRLRVHNIPVLGAAEILSDDLKLQLDEIVIAMPSAPAKRIKEIVKLLQHSHRKFTTVPSLDQLAAGLVSVSQLRPIEIEDLLGRQPVELERKNIEHYLRNRVVMVTGAGGSIGSELCRQVAQFHPKRLLLLDQSEVQLFQIEQEMIELGNGAMIQPLVGDVLDQPRMRQIFRQMKPEVIFHAAAHKHVPMMESQPAEAIKNNTLGTAQMAQLSLEFGVERFVMISTDKAINPTSVMGVTKRLAELFVQALHANEPGRTRFMAVRFGNVLGSSGSVIPTFKKQIAAGGPIKVTHPQMTRYFMTIPEAVSLVLQSGALGSGGEIFVLDMGNPVKIADLAKQLIQLSGFKLGEDIDIQYVGMRPGEKLFEELQHGAENLAPTNHPKILRFISEPMPLPRIEIALRGLQSCLHQLQSNDLKRMLKSIVPEYRPFLEESAGATHKPESVFSSWGPVGRANRIRPRRELVASAA